MTRGDAYCVLHVADIKKRPRRRLSREHFTQLASICVFFLKAPLSELSPPRPGLRRTPTSGGHGRSGGFGPRRAWARAEVATHPPWTSEGGVCGSSRSDGAEGPGTTAPPLISWKTPVAQEVEKGCNELMGPSFAQRPSLVSGGDASSASTPGRGRGFDIELFGLKRVMGRMEAEDGARAGDPGSLSS